MISSSILLTARLDNQEGFKQIVLEEKASQEAGLVPRGHRVINSRLRALFNEADWAGEQIGGPSYLFFLRKLAEKIDQNWPAVLADLEQIRRLLINRPHMLVNATVDAGSWQSFQDELENFLGGLPEIAQPKTGWKRPRGVEYEGLSIPAQVNYVGEGANLYQSGYQLPGSAQVVLNYLHTTYIWERVRVQGGAYGGYCLLGKRVFIRYSTFHRSKIWK